MIMRGKTHPGVIAIFAVIAIGFIVFAANAFQEILLHIDLYGLFSVEVFQALLAVPIKVILFLVGIVIFGGVIGIVIGTISKILR